MSTEPKATVIWDNGLFVCPKHGIPVLFFCQECYKEERANQNKIFADFILQSRKRNWAIIFGVFKE